jgi:Na+/H+ antiporter NhaA
MKIKFYRTVDKFLSTEASSGIVLAISAVIAMVVANSSMGAGYFDFLELEFFGLNL